MPSYVLKCKGCISHRSFLVHEDELLELEKKNPIEKHCPTCRMMTNWALAFPERRTGHDRRSDSDRRATE